MIIFKKGDILKAKGIRYRGYGPNKDSIWIVSSIKNNYYHIDEISIRKYNLKTHKYERDSYVYSQYCFDLYYSGTPMYKFLLRKKYEHI